MTVYSEVNKITYIGSSEQTLYPIPFEYINNDNIVVSIYSSDNKPLETWTYSIEYVVEGNNVRVLEGYQIDNSKKMLIERKLDIVQDNKYREGGDFPAKSTETSFDKLTMIAQQQKDELSRCPKVDSVYNINLTLPAPEAGKALIWNEGENGFRNSMVDVDELEAQTKEYRDQAEASKNAAQSSEANAKASELSAAQSAESAANTVNGFDDHAAEKQSQFDSNAESKTNIFNTNAAQKQAQVDASAETARKWAVGTLQEQSQGSAKYWAEQAQIATDGTLNYTNITNCITKIPQDIKLELNNGKLTLKAGSKVYVPNGVGVFEEKIIQNDINYGGGTNRTSLICIKPDGTAMQRLGKTYCYSGDTPPTGYTTFAFWYDTANNLIKFTNNNGDSWEEGYSLPICEAVETPTGWTSINQIFNGFGYIGNTIFTLPNVEGLIPNGRNADGSLNNTKFTVDKVLITTNLGSSDFRHLCIYPDINFAHPMGAYYDEEENICKETEYVTSGFCIVGGAIFNAGKVASFSPKQVFQAQDYHTAARVGDDNVFTGSNTFSGRVNFEAQRVIFKEQEGEGGEFLFEIPKSKVDELGNYWNVDVDSNGNIRFYRINGTAPKVITSINAKTGVINYEVGTALSASDNSTQVPTTAWVRGVSAPAPDYDNTTTIVNGSALTSAYTLPYSGWVWGCIAFGDTNGLLNWNGEDFKIARGMPSWNSSGAFCMFFEKGDKIYFKNTSSGDFWGLYLSATK